MRLVSFDAVGHPRAALLRDGRVYDIWGDASRAARVTDRTVDAILEGGLIDEVEPVDGDDGVPVEGVVLLPPVGRPGKLLYLSEDPDPIAVRLDLRPWGKGRVAVALTEEGGTGLAPRADVW